MTRMTPLGALGRGLLAGLVGSVAQTLFFSATSKIAPKPPEGVFEPPEPEQKSEPSTQTVARRAVEGMLHRDGLEPEQKEQAGKLVHLAFGSAWGGLYGLAAASSAPLRTLAGGLGFGLAVWMASDNVILPAFKLSAWPHKYPAKVHAYAVAAHLAYGAALFATFAATRRRRWAPAVATLGAAWAARRLPRALRRPARRVARIATEASLRASELVPELR